MKIKLLLSLLPLALGAFTLSNAPAQVLPIPDDHTVIAGWGGSNTFWTNPFTAGVQGLSTDGTFVLSSTYGSANRWNGALPNALNTSLGAPLKLATSNFTGDVPGLLTLQVASVFAPTTGVLKIGAISYTLVQAEALTEYAGTFHESGFNDARYASTALAAKPSLFSYTWDLGALGFTGDDFSAFTIDLTMPAQFYAFDFQLSTVSVPEPGTIGLIVGAALAGAIGWRRSKSRRA